MCPHNDFKIVYYVDGVMLRQCKHCEQIEIHLDRDWCGLKVVQNALSTARVVDKDW